MKYLNIKEIIKCVENYIENSSYNNALLIDGEWGTGKTYFINNNLQPHLQEKYKDTGRKVIYISLYGLSLTDEIDTAIYMKLFPVLTKEGKALNVGSRLLKAAFQIPLLSNITGDLTEIAQNLKRDILKEMTSFENCILICDDLERCQIDIAKLMGYINQYIEHNGCKVLLIANQKEIATSNISNNLELKYMVAINSKSGFENEKTNDELYLQALNQTTKNIFSAGIIYEQIKEKIIGNTIYFKPNISEIIQGITQNQNFQWNESAKQIILDCSDFIRDAMEEEKHNNIRTLLFAFDIFKNIYNFYKQLAVEIDENLETEIMMKILQHIVIISIKHKQGNKKFSCNDNLIDYEEIFPKNDYDIVAFKFIDNIIYYSYANEQEIRQAIHKYVEYKKEINELNDDPFNKLENWHILDDEIVLSLANELIQNLKNSKYSTYLYPSILAKLVSLIHWADLDININDAVSYMKENINLSENNNLDDFFEQVPIIPDELESLFNQYFKPLKDEVLIKNNEDVSKIINLIFDSPTWGEDFLNFSVKQNTRDIYLSKRKFLGFVNREKLSNAITHATAASIYYFETALYKFYKTYNIQDFFKEDLRIMKELKDIARVALENANEETQKILRSNLSSLIKQVDIIINKLEPVSTITETQEIAEFAEVEQHPLSGCET